MTSTTATHLPAEIQARICHYLCNHCYDPTGLGLSHQDFPEHWREKRALAALCATSRSWSAVARPCLYHVLEIPRQRRRYAEISCWDELARTLLQNRVLARDVTTFNQEATNGSPDWTQAVANPDELGFKDKRGQNVQLLPLIFACANRLQHLQLEVGDGVQCWDVNRWQSLLFRLRSTGIYGTDAEPEPQPFSQLKSLEFKSHYDWGYSIDAAIVLAVVQGAGPSLESLTMSNVVGGDWNHREVPLDAIQTPQLREIHLGGSAISAADEQAMQLLRQLCQTSTRLEKFYFTAQSAYIGESIDQHATAVDFLQSCLFACRDTLKVLSLDLSRFAWSMDRRASLASVEGAKSLRTFTKLEELVVEDFSICLHRHEIDPERRNNMPHTCLTGMLPSSLRRLVLRMAYPQLNDSGVSSDRGVWGDIIELVTQAAVKGGSFPDLRQIDVTLSVEEDDGWEYRSHMKIEDPIDVWMAAELQRRTKTLERLCCDTDIRYSIERVRSW